MLYGFCFFVIVLLYVWWKVEFWLFGVCSGLFGGVFSVEVEVVWLLIIEECVIVVCCVFIFCFEVGIEMFCVILRLCSVFVILDGV